MRFVTVNIEFIIFAVFLQGQGRRLALTAAQQEAMEELQKKSSSKCRILYILL